MNLQDPVYYKCELMKLLQQAKDKGLEIHLDVDKERMELEAEYKKVSAIMNASTDELKKLEEQAKEMGEEIKEGKELHKDKTYKIDQLVEGVEYKNEHDRRYKVVERYLYVSIYDEWEMSELLHNDILDFEFTECEFEPKTNTRIFYPDFIEEDGYSSCIWHDDPLDRKIQKVTGVYRTPEQAQEKARELGWL